MRGDERFKVSFSIEPEWIKALKEDWNRFKQAGGLSPFFSLVSDEAPMAVY